MSIFLYMLWEKLPLGTSNFNCKVGTLGKWKCFWPIEKSHFSPTKMKNTSNSTWQHWCCESKSICIANSHALNFFASSVQGYNSLFLILIIFSGPSPWLTNFFPKLKKEGLDSIHELNDVRSNSRWKLFLAVILYT